MRTVAVVSSRSNLGRLVEQAQAEPIVVTRNGQPAAMVVSADEYARYRAYLAEELLRATRAMHEEAASRGLTDDMLEELLVDDR